MFVEALLDDPCSVCVCGQHYHHHSNTLTIWGFPFDRTQQIPRQEQRQQQNARKETPTKRKKANKQDNGIVTCTVGQSGRNIKKK